MIRVRIEVLAKWENAYSYHVWNKDLAHHLSKATTIRLKDQGNTCVVLAEVEVELEAGASDENVREYALDNLDLALQPPHMDGIELTMLRDTANILRVDRLPAAMYDVVRRFEDALDSHGKYLEDYKMEQFQKLLDELENNVRGI